MAVILFVEDDEVIRSLAQDVFNLEGHKFFSAANGQQALEIFKNNHNEITHIMTDLNMPVMSGDELYYQIKEIKPDIPFYLITAQESYHDKVKRLIESGLTKYIQKPTTLKTLLDEIPKAA